MINKAAGEFAMKNLVLIHYDGIIPF